MKGGTGVPGRTTAYIYGHQRTGQSAFVGARTAFSMGDAGLEHPPLALSKSGISEEGGAKSDAQRAPKHASDPDLPPDLAEIVAVWPGLPGHIKAAIKALVQAHIQEKE
jgi:hypothetical protein